MTKRVIRTPATDDAAFSFSTAVKWIAGLAGTLLTAFLIFLAGWVWNQQDTVTKLSGALANLTAAVNANSQAIVQIQQSDGNQATTLATIAAQLANQQAANITIAGRVDKVESNLSDRMKTMEQQQMWRDRMGSGGGVQRR